METTININFAFQFESIAKEKNQGWKNLGKMGYMVELRRNDVAVFSYECALKKCEKH